MTDPSLEKIIDLAWEDRAEITSSTGGEVREAVAEALNLLDRGACRVAAREDGKWQVHQWLKKAVLLSFRLNEMKIIKGGPGDHTTWYDKVPSKFEGWDQAAFDQAGFRAVPSAVVRHSAYIAPGAVLMPSFVNLGGLCWRGHHG